MGNQPSGHPGGQPSGAPGGTGHHHDPRGQGGRGPTGGAGAAYGYPGQGGFAGGQGGGVSHSYHGSVEHPGQPQLQQQAQSSSSSQQQQQQGSSGGGVPRSSSDASMTMLDAEGPSQQQQPPDAATVEQFLNDDTVPTVFRWEHGGRQVYITGTFNGWSRQIPMHRSGNDFTYIHNLKRGKHAFKFIVDDEWRFAPDQPTVADIEGRINNFIDVTDFKAYTGDREFEKEKAAAEYGTSHIDTDPLPDQGGTAADGKETTKKTAEDSDAAGSGSNKPDRDGEVFSNTMPDMDDYTKEPPPLPPHLRHIILNKPPQLQDTAALPVPQHVALNHLYCTAIKDNMMVLGITQRYKTKFVTTVYYSPCANK